MDDNDSDQAPNASSSPTTHLRSQTKQTTHHASDEYEQQHPLLGSTADPLRKDNFDKEFTPPTTDINPQEDDEFVTAMLLRENDYDVVGSPAAELTGVDKDWIADARYDSIEWVIETRGDFVFQFRTAYLSIMYFDKFLSLQSSALIGKMWAIRLLAVACLSLAAKMEEVEVPPLLSYSTGPYADYHFRRDLIMRMELRVLCVLDWKMCFVSPFCFMHFFIRKFQALHAENGDDRSIVVATTAWFIYEAAKENSTVDYRPSVVAAAATLAAMDWNLTKESVEDMLSKSTVANYGFTATVEQVHSCYESMIKLLRPYNRLLECKPLVNSLKRRREMGSSSTSSEIQ